MYKSCVEYAKWRTGHQNEFWGDAKDLEPTTKNPYTGGIVILAEGSGHVAVIENIVGKILFISEANYIPGQKTERQIDMSDKSIIGYR